MLRLGKDIALLCEICHKPIAVSRIKAPAKGCYEMGDRNVTSQDVGKPSGQRVS